jgi:hypothetical protein
MKATVGVAFSLARWDGHCFECERGIHRGEKVRVNDVGQTVHLECPHERPVKVCTACWLQEPCEHSEGSA